MRRTPLRRKPKKVNGDPEARRAYMAGHQECEVSRWLWERRGSRAVYLPNPDWVFLDPHPFGSDDPHHIAGRGGSHFDDVSNLIAVGRLAHSWGQHRADFNVICVYAKWQNGELDQEVMSEILGKNFLAWFQSLGPKLELPAAKNLFAAFLAEST